jgi:DNA-directed RNA polymerase beta subunit
MTNLIGKEGNEMKEVKGIEKKDMHLLVKRYLEEHSLIESNILSFDDFLERRLQEIVNSINDELPREEVDLWLRNITVGRPQIIEADGSVHKILPIEARLRKLTYSAPVFLEISVGGKEYNTFEIGRVPVMIKSNFCNLSGMSTNDLIKNHEDPADTGGFFIVNGNERVLVMLEDLAQNQAFTERGAKGLMLRLYSSRGSYRIPVSVNQTPEGILTVSFSRFKNLPAVLLVKALGITKDSDIASLIGPVNEDVLIINLYETAHVQSVDDALNAVAKAMGIEGTQKEIMDRVKLRLDSAFLSHIGTKQESRREKAITLCKLIKQFLLAKKIDFESDRDHYANKRVRLSGDLLADLFRVNLTIFVRDLQHNLQKIARKKKFYSLKSLVKSTLFSHRIESAFATGNWIGQRSGVTQNMDKTNGMSVISQLQRVISLLPSEQENFKARTLHPTHYGRFCPIETPEGTSIGLRKNLAIFARVSTAVRQTDKEIIGTLEKAGLKVFK